MKGPCSAILRSRAPIRVFHFLSAGFLAAMAGCSSPTQLADPLNLLGLAKPPILIGVTTWAFSPPPLMIPQRSLFRQDLSYDLGESVVFRLMTARQIRVHLGTGRLKFAMLTPGDYTEIASADTCKTLAVPINANGHTSRRGLIIVAPKSPIQTLSDIKGHRFHFLPEENAILNEVALGALLESGIKKEDFDNGVLGLRLDTTHINSLEVAKSVVMEQAAAGVIDEADYDKWPEKGGSLLLLTPSKDQVRIIGKTVRVPEGPFVVSNETTPELTEKVRHYLLNVVGKKKLILGPMGHTGFAEPVDIKEYEPFFKLWRKLHPPEPEPEQETKTEPEWQPALNTASVPS